MKLKLLFFMLISVFSMQAKDGFNSKPDAFTFPNVGIVGSITGWVVVQILQWQLWTGLIIQPQMLLFLPMD
jgi:hypothetical protein